MECQRVVYNPNRSDYDQIWKESGQVGQWKGIMQSGFLEIPVVVTFTQLSTGGREWFGTGLTGRYWPMNQPTFETNIGTVLILKNSIRSGGKHYIEFKGSGNPKGPLAERINKAMGW